MTTATLRDPMPLPQVDEYGCQSCVTAQARWMLRLSDLAGQAAVDEVDRLTGRKPGRGIPVTFSVPVLLADGCEVAGYGPPDVDLARLAREGFAYFREYHADEWTEADDGYWTPPRLAEYAARVAREQALIGAAGRRYGPRLGRGPEFTIRHAEALLAGGWLIMTDYVDDHDPGECHAVLVYGRSGSGFRLYNPEEGGPGLEEVSWPAFVDMVRPYAVAVRGADL
jgi:hypothetical protein